jgi:DNA-binding NarL/FixJ family response regulator
LRTNPRQVINFLAERGTRTKNLKELLVGSKPVVPSMIHIALVEESPLRRAGFHSILDPVPVFRLTDMSIAEIAADSSVDLVLFGNYSRMNLSETMTNLRARRPSLRAVVTGPGEDDEVLKALTSGAKGYIDDAAPRSHFVQAIYAVHSDSVWAPRRVISLLVERSRDFIKCDDRPRVSSPTAREQQVLKILTTGCSNKEIGNLLGIAERTVKAHVAKLMYKLGAPNRVALSVLTVCRALVPAQQL